MNIFPPMKVFPALLLLAVIAGCATAPTQEMSDARQAVEAARDAGASDHAPDVFAEAEQALSEAEAALGDGNFDRAREKAQEARDKAMKARNMAMAIAEAQAAVDEAESKDALSNEARDLLRRAKEAAAEGDEQQAIRLARQAKEQAQADIRSAEAERRAAEKRNQDFLDRAKSLLDQARRMEDRMTDEHRSQLREAEQAYQDDEGEKAFNLASSLVDELRAMGPVEQQPEDVEYEVVRGDTLWDIAEQEEHYGDPFQWPLIYKNNQDKIRDADLIFPGQQFTINLQPSDQEVDAAVNHAKTRGAWSLGEVEDTDKAYLRGGRLNVQ